MNVKQRKKEKFLLKMMEAYVKQTDVIKRDKIGQSILEFALENNQDLSCYWGDLETLGMFRQTEQTQLYRKLSQYKINLGDLAVVSVKADFNELVSPTVFDQMFQRKEYCDNSGWQYLYYFRMVNDIDEKNRIKKEAINTNFNMGEIWEYAILSKDRKSFILLRDFLEGKKQPIENCIIYNDLSVGAMLARGNADNGRLRLPKSVSEASHYNIFHFSDENMENGSIGLEQIYIGNIETFNKQMRNIIEMRRQNLKIENGKKALEDKKKALEDKKKALKRDLDNRQELEF